MTFIFKKLLYIQFADRREIFEQIATVHGLKLGCAVLPRKFQYRLWPRRMLFQKIGEIIHASVQCNPTTRRRSVLRQLARINHASRTRCC